MVYQVEIHRLVQSKDVEGREGAVEELKNNFAIIKDKEQAWYDLHRLTQDKAENMRRRVARALGAYSHIPGEYKKQAWDDLHRLTQDNELREKDVNKAKIKYRKQAELEEEGEPSVLEVEGLTPIEGEENL